MREQGDVNGVKIRRRKIFCISKKFLNFLAAEFAKATRLCQFKFCSKRL